MQQSFGKAIVPVSACKVLQLLLQERLTASRYLSTSERSSKTMYQKSIVNTNALLQPSSVNLDKQEAEEKNPLRRNSCLGGGRAGRGLGKAPV